MHFNKMKHDIRARLSVAKITSSSDTPSRPVINYRSLFKLSSGLYLSFHITHLSPELHFRAN